MMSLSECAKWDATWLKYLPTSRYWANEDVEVMQVAVKYHWREVLIQAYWQKSPWVASYYFSQHNMNWSLLQFLSVFLCRSSLCEILPCPISSTHHSLSCLWWCDSIFDSQGFCPNGPDLSTSTANTQSVISWTRWDYWNHSSPQSEFRNTNWTRGRKKYWTCETSISVRSQRSLLFSGSRVTQRCGFWWFYRTALSTCAWFFN